MEFSPNILHWMRRVSKACDGNSPTLASLQPHCIMVPVDQQTGNEMNVFTKGKAENVYKLFLAALAIAAHKYQKPQPLIINTPGVKGEDKEKKSGLIFYLLRIDEQLSVRNLLKEIHAQFIEGVGHQWYAVKELFAQLSGMGIESPSFLHMGFSLEGFTADQHKEKESGINFSLETFDDSLYLKVSGTHQYGELFLTRFANHVLYAVKAMMPDLEKKVCEIDILSPGEQDELLQLSLGLQAEAHAPTVTNAFNEVVGRQRGKTALVFEDLRYTYGELNAAAGKLAAYLVDTHKVQKGAAVAVFLRPSDLTVITMLGIIKSGCAFLPIDVSTPELRVHYMLRDSGCRLVICESQDAALFSGYQTVLPSEWNSTAASLEIATDTASPAYIIYTSGTTGNPKGVLVSHRSITNYVNWLQSDMNVCGSDSSVLLSSYAFDLGYTSLWGMLLSGGCLHVIAKERMTDPVFILQYIADHAISLLKLTPSLFHVLQMSIGELHKLPSNIKTIFLGGEVLNATDIQNFLCTFPQVKFINHYGPTESTIGVVATVIDIPGLAATADPIIGKPIRGAEAYILDKDAKLLPFFAEGEICIGGKALALGYINQHELTKEKFVAHPFAPGSCLYRTGDLGKKLPDGNIVFLGRRDKQVKINGYRVELQEVEQALVKLPFIKSIQVSPVKNGDLPPVLVAFYISEHGNAVTGIKERISAWLPSHMIPVAYLHITHLPLTPNGKIDSKKLEAWYEQQYAIPAVAAPENPVQEKLVTIWQLLLQRPVIGINSNFFELGGHSLLAIKLIFFIKKEFAFDLSLADIFTHPTIQQLEQLISGRQQPVPGMKIEPAPPQPSYPLSQGQLEIWMLHKLNEAAAAYNAARTYAAKGNMNITAFRKTVSFLATRHESLRTVFREEEGIPRQVILSPGDLEIPVAYIDLQETAQYDLHQAINNAAKAVFDLKNGPLIRFHIFRLAPGDAILLLVQHHIITDAWSSELLMAELLEAYSAFATGQLPSLPSPSLQFKDYACWQAETILAIADSTVANFWNSIFPDAPPAIEFPFAKKGKEGFYNGNVCNVELDDSSPGALRHLGESRQKTMFTVLSTAIYILLSRYTGQYDITIGVPVTGRICPALENVVGFFANVLPVRCHIKPDDTFLDVLENFEGRFLDAYAHQSYPYSKITGGKWNVNILIDSININTAPKLTDPLTLTPAENDIVISKYELRFLIVNNKGQHNICIEYSESCFESSEIVSMCRHFANILRAILKYPTMQFSSLPLLDADESHHLIFGLNKIPAGYPYLPASQKSLALDKGIIHTLIASADYHKNAFAIEDAGTSLTYEQLYSKAARLSWELKAHYHAAKGGFIAVIMSRSADQVTAILGVLMAGCAFLPINPENPVHFVESLLSDANVKAAIVNEPAAASGYGLPTEKICHVSVLHDLDEEKHWVAASAPEDIAYLLYTSGSTGKHKGVMVKNAGFLNYVHWAANYYFTNTERIRFAYFTSVAFDLTLTSIFCTLLKGGTIVVFDQKKNIQETLAEVFGQKRAIDAVKMTPTHVSLVSHLKLSTTTVSCCILGGEQLHASHISILLALNEKMQIYNEYGPTETTIGCTAEQVFNNQEVNIGRPIQNTAIYLLDHLQQPVPSGTWGELCIGGTCVAAGYLNAEESTVNRFIANPFVPGEKMYRTGDVGRWLPNGKLALKGRSDDQVKIRGYRVELGEIEKQILYFPGVSSAAVICKEQEGDKFICAFLECADEVDTMQVQQYLVQQLPPYMIPEKIFKYAALPVNANGKIDRKKLAEIPSAETKYVENAAGRSATVNVLIDICREIFGLEEVFPESNFFNIGGHSLSSIQLASKMYKVLGVEVGLDTIFDNPVIKDLAAKVDSMGVTTFRGIPRCPTAGLALASNAQKRTWVLSQTSEGSISHHMQEVFCIPQPVSAEVLKQSLLHMVNRHEILRTVFMFRDGVLFQKVLEEIDITSFFTEITCSGNASALEDVINSERQKLFKLETGPLLRTCIIVSGTERYFCLTLHHIIADQWSLSIIIRDLEAGCRQALNPGTIGMKPLPVQYRDYSHWQYQQITAPNNERFIHFWKSRLFAPLPVTVIPPDIKEVKAKSFKGKRLYFDIEPADTARIKEACVQHNVTTFTFLLSAFYITVSKLTGSEDLVIGIPLAGRIHEDLEEQIGLFLNALPCRMTLTKAETVATFLTKVKQEVLHISGVQIYPVDMLIDDLNIPRSANGESPLFETVFNWANAKPQSLPDSTFFLPTALYGESHTAKHKLMLGGFEAAEKIIFCVEYSEQLYFEETIQIFSTTYCGILAKLARQAGTASMNTLLDELLPQSNLFPDFF